jgi:hypothetical protein
VAFAEGVVLSANARTARPIPVLLPICNRTSFSGEGGYRPASPFSLVEKGSVNKYMARQPTWRPSRIYVLPRKRAALDEDGPVVVRYFSV